MRVARSACHGRLGRLPRALLAWARQPARSRSRGERQNRHPGRPAPGRRPDAAGAHPDLVVRLDFGDSGSGTADSAEGVVMHLAPGIVSYVNHVDRCTAAQFGAEQRHVASTCPGGSLVGSTTDDRTGSVLGLTRSLPPLSGRSINVDPPAGSPAALGIDISTGVPGDDVKVIATIGVDPHDLGLTATLHGLPNTLDLPLLGGVGADPRRQHHADAVRLRRRQIVLHQPDRLHPRRGVGAPRARTAARAPRGSDSYTPTDCAGVPFSTRLAISVDPPISDWTSTVTTRRAARQQRHPPRQLARPLDDRRRCRRACC